MEASLRIWADHPYNARFLTDVRTKLATGQKIQRILEGMQRDGWVVQHDEDDSGEISWVAERSFEDDEDPDEIIAAAEKHNPQRWGSFFIDGEEIW